MVSSLAVGAVLLTFGLRALAALTPPLDDGDTVIQFSKQKYLPTPSPDLSVPGICSSYPSPRDLSDRGTVNVKSSLTNQTATFTDYCVPGTNQVVKYSCGKDIVHKDIITCPSRCVNGMCKGNVYVAYTVDTELTQHAPTGVFKLDLDTADFEMGGLVDKATDPNGFYRSYTDSFGGKPKYSWFLLATEPYCNSVQKDCTGVHDAMKKFSDRIVAQGDELAFHYHHNGWTTNPNDGFQYWNQLLTMSGKQTATGTDLELGNRAVAATLISQHTYPSVFRSGWAFENDEFSRWLDDLFPYDFSNLSPSANIVDIMQGPIYNIYDWHRAPLGTSFYHPSLADYQSPGSGKRVIFRNTNSTSDMYQAFRQADSGYDAFIVTVTHTYNDGNGMEYKKALATDASLFPDVKYKFVTAYEGAHAMLHQTDTTAPSVLLTRTGNTFRVTSNEPLFNYPFAAVQVSGNDFRRLYPLVQAPEVSGNLYSWTYNADTFASLKTTSTQPIIAFGGTDSAGNTFATDALAL